jgi:hypothetical protein
MAQVTPEGNLEELVPNSQSLPTPAMAAVAKEPTRATSNANVETEQQV